MSCMCVCVCVFDCVVVERTGSSCLFLCRIVVRIIATHTSWSSGCWCFIGCVASVYVSCALSWVVSLHWSSFTTSFSSTCTQQFVVIVGRTCLASRRQSTTHVWFGVVCARHRNIRRVSASKSSANPTKPCIEIKSLTPIVAKSIVGVGYHIARKIRRRWRQEKENQNARRATTLVQRFVNMV